MADEGEFHGRDLLEAVFSTPGGWVESLRVVPSDRSTLRCCLSLQSISTTGKMSDEWMIL